MDFTVTKRILVMYASPFDMITEDKEKLTGCSVQYYFFGQEGEELGYSSSTDGTGIGYQRAKTTMRYEDFRKFQCVPGIYDGVFSMTVDSKGKANLKLDDLEFVGEANFLKLGEDLKAQPKRKEDMKKKAVEGTTL